MTIERLSPRLSRRSGGREARRTLRAGPLADDLRPVRAGLSGGQFRPLDDAAMTAINDTVFQILDEIGLSQVPQSGIDYMTAVGAILGEDGRLRFPRSLVEDTLAKCARHITLYGQDPKHDMLLSGSRVHYGTAGAAVHVVDVIGNNYRESYLADIYDAARIVEKMDNIHFFSVQWWHVKSPTHVTLTSILFMRRSRGQPNMLGSALLRRIIWFRLWNCYTALLAARINGGHDHLFQTATVLLCRRYALPLSHVW